MPLSATRTGEPSPGSKGPRRRLAVNLTATAEKPLDFSIKLTGAYDGPMFRS